MIHSYVLSNVTLVHVLVYTNESSNAFRPRLFPMHYLNQVSFVVLCFFFGIPSNRFFSCAFSELLCLCFVMFCSYDTRNGWTSWLRS